MGLSPCSPPHSYPATKPYLQVFSHTEPLLYSSVASQQSGRWRGGNKAQLVLKPLPDPIPLLA